MNIESTKINLTQESSTQKTVQNSSENDGKFAEELKNLKKPVEEKEIKKVSETNETETSFENQETEKASDKQKTEQISEKQESEKAVTEQNSEQIQEKQAVENILVKNETEQVLKKQNYEKFSVENELENPVKTDLKPEISTNNLQEDNISEDKNFDNALNKLNFIVKELNQSEEIQPLEVKDKFKQTDNKEEGDALINNDFNIQENKDLLPQMNPNMNFGGDGQPFSSFMNNAADQQSQSNDVLKSSAKEIAEEAAILSTMAENIAMANKAKIDEASKNVKIEEPKEKVVNREDGIKKINTKTGIVEETVVKYDNIIMNEADVEVFANLVQNGEVDMNNLAPEAAKKSVHVSKTLADMLAKAMEDNKPVRIDFDNNISVIIKISRDGKLTADFLPSSQVAEAYLKENLPLLKQRFDDENIKYDELNQRERRNKEQDDNRKKGRENE